MARMDARGAAQRDVAGAPDVMGAHDVAGARGAAGARSDTSRTGLGDAPKRKRHVGAKLLVALGLLLVAAAVGLAAYNVHEDRRAEVASARVVEQLIASMGKAADAAGVVAAAPLATDDMPTVVIDGRSYVGMLQIPSLGLELPVLAEWSDDGAEVAPCRYSGSVYTGSLVVAGHNYVSHFGNLYRLQYGAEVVFVDVRGNAFAYQVASIEELGATAVQDMTESEWPLTLFTCDFSGANRVTVRCAEAGK